uniref:Capsid protein n=1 Tax=Miniopterus bat astrovirus TaxID=3141885 RepID=A0AAU7E1D6_9VIRU
MPNKGKKTVAAAAKQAAVAAVKAVEKQHANKKKVKLPRAPKPKPVPKSEIKKVVDKEVGKKLKKIDGPKSQYQVSVSATLGYVTGNESHGPNLKLTSFLHPALCKSPDESTNFGPLQAAAAQYGLWRVSRAHITFTPLVGPNAISGTIIRGSVNLSQSPSSTGWGGLGARKHLDLQAGVKGFFKLSRRDLAGPRDGGWWVTDTNVEGQQSAGPVFEVHALGESTSTYQNTEFKREVYIVEMKATWQFCNYVSNPAMGLLDRKEAETKVSFSTTEQKEIVMNVEGPTELLRYLDDPTVERASGDQPSKPGEVIWQLADTAAEAVSGLMPPPFGWLARGGWWFIKKIAGRASFGFRNSGPSSTFLVYPSLADAQNNRPAVATSTGNASNQVDATLQFTQMNAPNMGGVPSTVSLASPSTFPVKPDFPPESGSCIFKAVIRPCYYARNYETFPKIFMNGTLKWTTTNATVTARATVLECQRMVALRIPGNEDEITRFGVPSQGPTGIIQFHDVCQQADLNPIVLADKHVQVANNVWLHAWMWTATKDQQNFKFRATHTKHSGYLLTTIESTNFKIESNNIDASTAQLKYNQTTTGQTPTPEELTLGKRVFLSTILTTSKNGGPEINWSSQKFGVDLRTPIPDLFAILFMHTYPEGFKHWFELDIKQSKKSRVEKLAERLGLTLADFESDTDEDDFETDTDESDAEERESNQSEFDVIPQPGGADDYLILREQGLSHQEALDVIAAKKPAV